MILDQPSPTSKKKQAKQNLDFSAKEEEVLGQGENILNLPYSEEEEEEKKQEVDLTK